MSICLFLSEDLRFRTIDKTVEISVNIDTGYIFGSSDKMFSCRSSQNNLRNQFRVLPQYESAMYSASREESAIVDCLLVVQSTGASFTFTRIPVVDFLVSRHPG